MDEELLRRSPAGCRKQRLCPTYTQMLRMFLGASGKRWGTGRANSLHSQWVLKCDFTNPALLWSHYLKACLQHWKLLNVFSCKVVASMYIFILQSPTEGNVWRLSFYEVKAGRFYGFNLCISTWSIHSGVAMICRNFSGHGSHRLITEPYLSMWGFSKLLKGNSAVL